MENGQKDPQTSKSKSEEDGLSSLPCHISEMILSLMPLDVAIETSRLSKHWRYQWRNIPDLILDFEKFEMHLLDRETVTAKMLSKINWVVSNHSGNVRKFVLWIGNHIETNLASSWILNAWFIRLIYSNIQALAIWRFPNENHMIPSSIFEFKKLKILTLIKCTFRLPHLFMGFNHLTSLQLTDVRSTGQASSVENLIQLCPLLEHLYIYCIEDPLVLNHLHAIHLETLVISGTLLNLNNLKLQMMFKMVYLYVLDATFTGESTIETFLKFCPNLEILTISYEDEYTPLLKDFCAPKLEYLYIFGCSLNLNMNNFVKLTTLFLIHNEIKIQTNFDCLKSLTYLHFEYITFLKKSYTVDCPLLQDLFIGHLLLTSIILKLHAPNLKHLTIYGTELETVRRINFVHPNATTTITSIVNGFTTLENESNLDYKFLEDAENLHLIDLTLEYLENHRILQTHAIKFEEMKIFGIYYPHSFSKLIKNDAFIYILRNSPALENLYTFCQKIKNEEDEGYLIDLFEYNNLGVKFDKLKILNMDKVSASKTEEMFIGYVLHNAPRLEEMDIKLFIWVNRRYIKTKFTEHLRTLKTTSGSTAEIKISEFHDPFTITTL